MNNIFFFFYLFNVLSIFFRYIQKKYPHSILTPRWVVKMSPPPIIGLKGVGGNKYFPMVPVERVVVNRWQFSSSQLVNTCTLIDQGTELAGSSQWKKSQAYKGDPYYQNRILEENSYNALSTHQANSKNNACRKHNARRKHPVSTQQACSNTASTQQARHKDATSTKQECNN